jgi:transcriptional regulator with XRE-family HTH domain
MQFRKFKSKLLTRTVKLLTTTKLPSGEIARCVGVSKMWLSNLRNGKMPNPSVHKVEMLHKFLTGGHIRFD